MLDEFAEHLRLDCPPLARIEEINVVDLEPLGEQSQFEIRKSQAAEDKFVLVSPDVASCDQCLSDISDVHNRRFAYSFTNCTNCGPRYTIIRDIPYDRPTTTMAGFRMCADCEAEYHDPRNRRFHAQPNACPACGPRVVLAKSGSAFPMDADFRWADSIRAFTRVRKLLREAAIVAVKGLGGFQLACDASNALAVQQLRQRKKRSDKPFALMTRDICDVEKIANPVLSHAACNMGMMMLYPDCRQRRPSRKPRSHNVADTGDQNFRLHAMPHCSCQWFDFFGRKEEAVAGLAQHS
jgi:hydrogenase maturation protein HypF